MFLTRVAKLPLGKLLRCHGVLPDRMRTFETAEEQKVIDAHKYLLRNLTSPSSLVGLHTHNLVNIKLPSPSTRHQRSPPFPPSPWASTSNSQTHLSSPIHHLIPKPTIISSAITKYTEKKKTHLQSSPPQLPNTAPAPSHPQTAYAPDPPNTAPE